MENSFFVPRLLVLCVFLALAFLCWFLARVYRRLFALSFELRQKYENLEKLLFDLRDGTKIFYKEKRGATRIREKMIAKIVKGGGPDEFIQVVNASTEGVLLRSSQKLKENDVVELMLYLPLFAEPISVRSKVVRTDLSPEGECGSFDIGIRFLSLSQADAAKFKETLKLLQKKEGMT